MAKKMGLVEGRGEGVRYSEGITDARYNADIKADKDAWTGKIQGNKGGS